MRQPFFTRATRARRFDPETIAIAALAYIAADAELMSRFMALTGLEPGMLRQAAATPGFLGAVLDFLGEDEPVLLAFAAAHGFPPEDVAAARQSLSGPPGDG